MILLQRESRSLPALFKSPRTGYPVRGLFLCAARTAGRVISTPRTLRADLQAGGSASTSGCVATGRRQTASCEPLVGFLLPDVDRLSPACLSPRASGGSHYNAASLIRVRRQVVAGVVRRGGGVE